MMSGNSVVPLDSYRLAQYSEPVYCYICEEGNNFDAELCRHCQAPLALAHQAAKLKAPPTLAAIAGSADAGKTVFLGMLTDILSRPHGQVRMLARGPFTISLQQETMRALSHCVFPDKTPNEPDRWNWMHYQVQAPNRRRPVEVIMPDMAGEALMEEVNHPHSYPVIRKFLERTTALFILVDAARVFEGDQDQDFHSMKILNYLLELNGDRKKGWPSRPVAVVFTKADQCESCFDDPEEFARRHAPVLWRHCQERLERREFFATTVAGACGLRRTSAGRLDVPLRIEPRGVEKPFVWLLEQLK